MSKTKKEPIELLVIKKSGFKKKLIDPQGFQLGDLKQTNYDKVLALMKKHKNKLVFYPIEPYPGVKLVLNP